jgi:hypothetical protein
LEDIVNYIFEDLRRTKAANTFHQLHFGDHGGVVSLMRYLEGVLDLLGVVQATHLIIFIPAK